MATILHGIDVSMFQKAVNYDAQDFIIIKATEGRTWKDPLLDTHYNRIKGKNKLYGFYHYARPENNGWKAEADNFLSRVGHHAGKAIFALDWEGTALRYNHVWALNWLNYVYQRTGVRPLFYTSDSQTARYAAIAKANYGLWVAHYGVKHATGAGWPCIAIWQYTSAGGLDKDIFYGDHNAWMAYAGAKHSGLAAKPATQAAKAQTKQIKKASGYSQFVYDVQRECVRQGFAKDSKAMKDGIFGNKTLAACPTLRVGAKGNLTGLVQGKLNSLGFNCGKVDKIFGNATKNAVVAFQKSRRLLPDGIVGKNTWRALLTS